MADELETKYGMMTDGMVALKRDLAERSKLDELSKGIKGPVVTFTDGPIELWGAKAMMTAAYQRITKAVFKSFIPFAIAGCDHRWLC